MNIWALVGMAAVIGAPPAAEVRLQTDVAYLTDPAREGRGNGSAGLAAAADFVARRYAKLGLKPLKQQVPFVSRVTRALSLARLGGRELVWGKEIEAVGFSADGELAANPMMFAGYGVTTTGHDDLAGLDLKGKVAVILRTVPSAGPLAALGRVERGLLSRASRLHKAGAAAIVVLEAEDTPRPLAREEGPLQLELPVLSLPAKQAGEAVADAARQLQETGKAASRELPERFSLKLKLERHSTPLPNVAALLPGRDPKLKQDFIVVGAHLDHLGRGERGSLAGEAGRGQVHPGADDNASGTAVVMELARALKANPARRPVVFLHVSGEEAGLLGSAHWVQNATVPLPQVKFMVNFDMVGRMDVAKPTIQLGGLGAPKTAVARAKGFAPEGVAVGEDLGFAVGGSDHMSFASAKIPTFFFFTGVHSDYHRPSDSAEKLNVKGMAQVAAMAEKVIRDLADADQLPAFDPETAKLPAMRGGGPVRVAFGTLPDFADHPKGFRINGASPGSAAEAIGMQAGDVLISFGGKPIRNLYDFQEALTAHKPGDTVTVVWLRGDARMEKDAVLKGR